MTKPLITALIDTYNHEKYIGQAIDSVLEQGLSNAEMEVLVVDDGSTDETPSIVEKFAPRVRHLRKVNGGQASAFNAGFGESSGEIVALLDGDDWWAKGKLAKVLDTLDKNAAVAAVSHGYYEVHEGEEARVHVPPNCGVVNAASQEGIGKALGAWPFLLPSALTVRRRVLEWIMPLPEVMRFMADTPIQVAALMLGTLVIDEPLFYYRQHRENLWAVGLEDRAKLARKFEMTDLVYKLVCEMLLQRGISRECVANLIDPNWIGAKRSRLKMLGGSPLETFQVEMQAFHTEFKNPGLSYRLFKYVVTGAPMLLLPPRAFYRLRDWYARRNLGRLRARVCKPV
jgi:glycosyltransferase involved in cell wall biosynthesis